MDPYNYLFGTAENLPILGRNAASRTMSITALRTGNSSRPVGIPLFFGDPVFGKVADMRLCTGSLAIPTCSVKHKRMKVYDSVTAETARKKTEVK